MYQTYIQSNLSKQREEKIEERSMLSTVKLIKFNIINIDNQSYQIGKPQKSDKQYCRAKNKDKGWFAANKANNLHLSYDKGDRSE